MVNIILRSIAAAYKLALEICSDLIVHLPNLPVSPSAVSPDAPEKRSHQQYDDADKENFSDSVYAQHSQKRSKPTHRLSALATSTHTNYDTNAYSQPFIFAPQTAWRDPPPPHLSPYPHSGSELAYGSDYSRSPVPEAERSYHPNHLAPIYTSTHSHSHSPIDSPVFPQSATIQPSASSAFYSRNSQSYMQRQQTDYLQSHGHPQAYDYGSPYLSDSAWDGGFTQTAQA